MSGSREFLLDTNIVLHATRADSKASAAIEAQFGLSTSRFRPTISEVSVGELLAFTQSAHWGEKRKELLRSRIRKTLVIPIGHPGPQGRFGVFKRRRADVPGVSAQSRKCMKSADLAMPRFRRSFFLAAVVSDGLLRSGSRHFNDLGDVRQSRPRTNGDRESERTAISNRPKTSTFEPAPTRCAASGWRSACASARLPCPWATPSCGCRVTARGAAARRSRWSGAFCWTPTPLRRWANNSRPRAAQEAPSRTA